MSHTHTVHTLSELEKFWIQLLLSQERCISAFMFCSYGYFQLVQPESMDRIFQNMKLPFSPLISQANKRWQLCIPTWRSSSSILPWWHLSSKDSWMILLYWPFQFGFRPECGTETTLVTLADDLYWELDRRNTSLLVLLNLSTAVNHLSGPLCRDVLAGAVP